MSAAGVLVTYAAWCALPTALFAMAAAVLSPEDNRVKRLGSWVVSRIGEVRSGPAQQRAEADPFEVLAVQLRLERLAAEIIDLKSRPARTARRHHLIAAVQAYEDLLEQACRLAGVALPELESGPVRRMMQEAELRARGWTW